MDRRRDGFVDNLIVNTTFETHSKNCYTVVTITMRGNRFGYKMATKILKTQRKTIFSENITTESPENTPSVTQGSPSLIREGGRTVGSGRVATIVE